jgi:hypothetical protein
MYNNQSSNRPFPHLAIPSGTQVPETEAFSPYAFEVTAPPNVLVNPWEELEEATTPYPSEWPARPRSRTTSASTPSTNNIAFPEPQLFRSSSHRSNLRSTLQPSRPLQHQFSKSDNTLSMGFHRDMSVSSLASTGSSYYLVDDVDMARFPSSRVSIHYNISIFLFSQQTRTACPVNYPICRTLSS